MNVTLRKSCPVLLVLVLAVAIVGCAGVKGPNWLHPGTAADQQKQAERFDPYPDNQIAPEVVGGRPREYLDPIRETERARWPVPGVRQ
jgi:predicted small lipoprotein YifL